MKHIGNTADFMVERDRELLENFKYVLGHSVGMALRDMFAETVMRPASRFWVSEERAGEVIGRMLRGEEPENMLPERRAMYMELLTRVRAWQAGHPGHTLADAVRAAVHSPAPRFYLTAKSAKVIIYRIRARKRMQR